MNSNQTNLFCIPFSGGNAYSYSGFKKYFQGNIKLCNLELPGRGKRIAEPLLYSIDAMTEDLFRQIEHQLDNKYVIYGHSLGALLAIKLCRHIAAQEKKLPLVMIFSGQTAPSLISADRKHTLPDSLFIDMLRKMEGTPEELLSDTGFLEYFLPVARADFQSISEYKYTPSTPLNVPAIVMLGDEENISDDDAARWQEETNCAVLIHRFKGGHFFIYNDTAAICNLISRTIQSYI